jgi:hypothetical protein
LEYHVDLGRAFVWKPAARFIDEKDLCEDAELDGIFARDPTLRDFLATRPDGKCVAFRRHALSDGVLCLFSFPHD